MWWDVLAEAGVTVETVDADHVRLRDANGDYVMRLRRIDRIISPSQVPVPASETSLLALPKATTRTVAAAGAVGWNVVTDNGMLTLTLGKRHLHQEPTATTRTPDRRPGPTSWATFTVVRRILVGRLVNQVELARRAGVSQSKVSRALQRLSNEALVERTESGWRPTEWDKLVDWWLQGYPGPAGVTSHWYSLDDPTTQVTKALDALDAADARAVISGDVAADVLAPWRRPTTVTVYVHRGASLAAAGFVPVSSPNEATLILCAPKDPGLWLPTPWIAGELPLADPLQVLYDVARGAGTDREEAATHLREALRTKLDGRWLAAVTGSSDE